MPKQESLSLYGKGIHKTKDGHLRYHSPRMLKNKYVHRAIVEKLIEETPYSVRLLLPWPYEVHHMDYNKENNVAGNFLILSEAFHSILTADRKRASNGKFGQKFNPKWEPPPKWAQERMDFQDACDEVPF